MISIRHASAIKKVAKQNGVPVSEVYAEMSAAITQAMQSEDPDVKEFWENHFHGRTPLPEELIGVILEQIDKA